MPDATRIHDLVHVITAPNAGPKTLQGTHTYLVGGGTILVIDPGPSVGEHQENIAEWMRHQSREVAAILLTHGHPDHAPGARLLKSLLGCEVVASPVMQNAVARSVGVDRRLDSADFWLEGARLGWYPAPGHTPDHVVFLLRDERILFAGDLILGTGTTLIAPPEGDMIAYMRSLTMIRDLNSVLIAPGHGPAITDPAGKIDEYIRHRLAREKQLMKTLERGPATVSELVSHMYRGVSPEVRELAVGSVLAQVAKLVREGRIIRNNGLIALRQ